MAVDEALLEYVSVHQQPTTLRLYDWQPYALSLGHAQAVSDVDLAALDNRGWGLVRRPTGGRAILHADEITYSLTAPIENPVLRGNVIQSYRRISGALLEALQIGGLCVDSQLKNATESHLAKDPVCFQFPSDYEITFQGKKIIGSAQARRKNGILQHGSIPLTGDITRITDVLHYQDEAERSLSKEKLFNRATTVHRSLGRMVSWQQMAEALISGFESALEIHLAPGRMTTHEMSRALELNRDKYNHPDWTYRI